MPIDSMDPTDYHDFYPHTPNKVIHRTRTTSQLKVLEGIFKRDTKPNAALRAEIAAQLNMTARGVQVWYQNRRAKEKTKANVGVSPSSRSSEDPGTLAPWKVLIHPKYSDESDTSLPPAPAPILSGNTIGITSIAVSPDSKRVAVSSDSGMMIHSWDPGSWRIVPQPSSR
ncbi:hypothetical protein B0H13DRAFT_2507486 [Mycena leptocephala]|nr:hypothetical protein B0H13DRAFT_2507486 [Mycena leptocephala]